MFWDLIVEDIIKSIKAYLYDKAVSPFLGSLTISWMVWNYRFLLIVFSSESINRKFSLINELYSWPWSYVLQGALLPLVTALFFIYGYPIFSVPIYRAYLANQKKLNDEKLKHHEGKILTYEQSRELIKRMNLQEAEYRKELSTLEDDKRALTEVISKYESSREGSLAFQVEKAMVNMFSDLIRLKGGSDFLLSRFIGFMGSSIYSDDVIKQVESRFKKSVIKGEFSNIKILEDSDPPKYFLEPWENLPDFLDKKEQDILTSFAKNSADSLSLTLIIKKSELHRYQVKYAIANLVNKNFLVKEDSDDPYQEVYSLGVKGYQYLAEHPSLADS